MDKSHLLSFPMIVHSLEGKNEFFHSKENNKELLGLEVPYLSVIGALIYLTNCMRPYIMFFVNSLTRYSAPTRKYWNRVNHIL